MTLSPRTKHNFLRILPFGVIWLICGWFFLAIEFAAVEDTSEWADSAIRMDFSIFIFASVAVLIVGLFLGLIEIAYVDKLFARVSFGKKLLYKIIFYMLFFSVINLITFPIAASLESGMSLFNAGVWERYSDYLVSKTHFSTLMQMSASQFLALFYAEIGENIGQKALINFFTGKYHKPVEENRIFMFADMRSSTAIAERLGHHAYFALLHAFYEDLSRAIVDHAGEIYQYAGDEVIISWPLKSKTQNAHCVRCFFAMRADLARRAEWYTTRFGIAPVFKAGLHSGLVTSGEIGVIRKEIFFTSDVLNTAARIQGLCNTYDTDILVSGDLVQELDLPAEYIVTAIGETALRGKTENMEIYTIAIPEASEGADPKA